MAGDKSYGSDGKQGVKAGSDCGAKEAFNNTATPASVKKTMGSGVKTKYR